MQIPWVGAKTVTDREETCTENILPFVQMSLQAQIAAARIFIGFIQAAPGTVNLTSFTNFAIATSFQRPLLNNVIYVKAVRGSDRTQVGALGVLFSCRALLIKRLRSQTLLCQ